jgi:hypothetical protein
VTTVFNFYGGPGTGKSTSAAFVFYLLKAASLDAELVREYAKNWAWEKRNISLYDQYYLLGKQIRHEAMLYKKVDYVVTDSPVLLNVYYAQAFTPRVTSEGIRAAVLSYYEQAERDGHRHVHVMLTRSKPYNPAGRYQSEAEARAIDSHLRTILTQLGLGYTECPTTEEGLRALVGQVAP